MSSKLEDRGFDMMGAAACVPCTSGCVTAQIPDFLRLRPQDDGGCGPVIVTGRTEPEETILQEAQRLTHGPRQADYSHPLDDYTRTAALVNAALRHKLRVNLEPEDVTVIMLLVKVSRQMHKPKRDNMTDAAGYAWCTHAIAEERERRHATMNQVQSAGAQKP